MRKRIIFLSICISILFLRSNSLHASHVVGGQLTYKNLGKNYFEVTIIFRRDCFGGDVDAPLDNPALLGVFYELDNQKAIHVGHDGVILLKLLRNDTLQENIDGTCRPYMPVCVHQAVYRDTIYLPYDDSHPGGYILAYQRCCRNKSLTNIERPDSTGATYTTTISGETLLNHNDSGPSFRDTVAPPYTTFPPIYICANKPFNFDNKAIDIDGDSLVYKLCTPLEGKSFSNPGGRPDFPPYDTITWKSPYNNSNLLGNGSQLTIDPHTGQINANAQTLGQFLVGVCVYEYRKGILIGSSFRDFELNVVACGRKPVAKFERTSPLCDGLKVSFKNTSTDGIDFTWYFDWQNNKNLISTVFSPTYTYSKAGQYDVVLIAKNNECGEDTTHLLIDVIDPKLKADFIDTVTCKHTISIQLTNKSTSNDSIIKYQWLLSGPKDKDSSMLKNPKFDLKGDGKITIKLIITDKNGCTSDTSQTIDVKLLNYKIQLLTDTICRGDSLKIVKNPDSHFTYFWDPKNTLNLKDTSDPIAKPNKATTYSVTVTNGLCSDTNQTTIYVRDRIHVSVSGDTSLCNGKVDLLAKSDSATIFMWSLHPNFIPIIFTGNHYQDTISGTKKYFVKGGTAEQCPDTTSITVTDNSVNLKYSKEYTICVGDTLIVDVIDLNTRDHDTISWSPNPIIIGPTNVFSPKIYCPAPGRYVLYFTIKNQFDCSQSDSIIITAVVPPNPDFILEHECGSLTIKVTAFSDGKVSWDFGDTIGTSHDKSTSYTYKKHGKYIVTLTVDSICVRSLQKEVTVVELKSSLPDTAVTCLGDSVQLNPGANPNYHYKWTPITGLNDPNSPSPIAKDSVSTAYYVTITDPDFPDSCSLKDSILVIVPPVLLLKAVPDTILCEKGKITLRVTANLPGIEFEWCDANGHPIGKGSEVDVIPEKSTFYIVKAFDAYGCAARDTVHIELYELMDTLIGPDIICIGDTTFIKANAGIGTNYHYKWSPKEFIIGSDTSSIIYVNPPITTTYTVTITNDHNCVWELSKTVTVNNPQLSLNVKADPDTIVAGQVSHLTATQKSFWKYLWKPNDGTLSDSSIYNPDATPVKTTSYTVTVTDEAGCTAAGVVTVVLKTCEESVFLPTGFSPNDDKINDVLYVRYRGMAITKMELVIYNRWGEKIFITTDPAIGWDGSFKGEKLKPDVFGYGLKFTCHEKQEYVRKGNINLLK